MIAADDTTALATLCANHLRHEELLLEAILPILRGIEASFGKPDFEKRADEQAENVARLVEMMSARRQKFRNDLAPWLGLEPADVKISLAIKRLPPPQRPALDEASARVRSMVEEFIKRTYAVALHLRFHLDAFNRLICELTGTSGSGRYGPLGQAESPSYRPFFQTRG